MGRLTYQKVAGVLRKAGFKQSKFYKGRVTWRATFGFEVRKGHPSGVVRVRHCRGYDNPEEDREWLDRYTASLEAAGLVCDEDSYGIISVSRAE